MPTVTMKELLARFSPKSSVLDSGVTRAIARAMRAKGYTRKKMRWKGKVQWVWTNEDKLGAIEKKVKNVI